MEETVAVPVAEGEAMAGTYKISGLRITLTIPGVGSADGALDTEGRIIDNDLETWVKTTSQ